MNTRLRVLRKDVLKLSLKDFGKAIGLSGGGVSDIEQVKCKLNDRNFKIICSTFNVNEEWLRSGVEPIFKGKEVSVIAMVTEKYDLTEFSKGIVERYVNLPIDKQKEFENFILNLPTESSKVKTEQTIEEEQACTDNTTHIEDYINIRLYESPVSAGTGSLLTEDTPYETIQVKPSIVPQVRKADFALVVKGDSMQDTFYNGDIVYVKEQPYIDNNQIGIFIYDNDAYIKKYYKDEKSQISLISLNKKYEPIEVKEDVLFKICGIVL